MMWKKYMNFRFQWSQMNFSCCTTTLIHLLLFTAALFCKGRGPSCSCDRHNRAHRLKYLLSGPFERSFADPCSPHLYSSLLPNTPALSCLHALVGVTLFIVPLTISVCQNTAHVLRPSSISDFHVIITPFTF